MKVLLTGGTGYIGSHIAIELIEAGHKVVLLDNLSNSRPDVVNQLEEITQQKIPFIEADVRNTSLVSSSLQYYQIESVIHCAGLKASAESVSEPLKYFYNNVGGAISLLEAMRINDVKTLIFSSSATVYGEPKYLPIDELHPTNTNNPYGRTKLHIEQILNDLALSDLSWRILCLRYFNPVGAHKSALIGENPNGTPNNLMPYLAEVASGIIPYINVYGSDYDTPDGTGVRDYIHIMDLARAHLSALCFSVEQTGFHIFNLGTGKGYSVLEMIKTFEKVSGIPLPFRVVQRRAGDVSSCYAAIDKASMLMGWNSTFALEDMCASLWNFKKSINK
jgi:UDP-glucose 4-epimerase